MPDDFPKADFDAMVIRVDVLDNAYRAQHQGQPREEWRAFISACTGAGVRFRAMTEAEGTYVATVAQSNDTPENIWVQDTALFDFFTNAVSALECLCFACFALAAQLQPTGFPMKSEKNLRAIIPKTVIDKFEMLYPRESVASVLKTIFDSTQYEELLNIRNVLSHRGNPPRHYHATLNLTPGAPPQNVFLGGSQGAPPTWHGFVLDTEALGHRRVWVAQSVRDLVAALSAFVKTNIPET